MPIEVHNDAPTVMVPATPTSVAILGTASLRDIVVNDIDSYGQPVTVRLDLPDALTDGTLHVEDMGMVTFAMDHPNDTSSVWFAADLAVITSVLAAGVTYTAPATPGDRTLTVTLYDSEYGGMPGALETSGAMTLTVTP